MNKKTTILTVFALVAIIALSWLYRLPNSSLEIIQKAALQDDHEKLKSYVDFFALRASIKENIWHPVDSRLQQGTPKPFAVIRRAIGNAVMNPLLESFVSPAGISALVQGMKPDPTGRSIETANSTRVDTDMRGEYESLSQYVFHYRERASGQERLALIFIRDGLTWKLSGIRLPSS